MVYKKKTAQKIHAQQDLKIKMSNWQIYSISYLQLQIYKQ